MCMGYSNYTRLYKSSYEHLFKVNTEVLNLYCDKLPPSVVLN